MALNFADRLVSNNPSAYGIVRAIEVSGHKTVSSLSALYKIPDCILSDSGNNTDNDSIGQLWYVVDQKEVYQLIDWEKRNDAEGWKSYLSGQVTDEELEELLATKQDKLTAGEGISISEDNVISCTIDTSLFRMVDELPPLEEAETNKIYLLKKENNIGELQSYTEYIVSVTLDEEGREVKDWEKIGEYDLSVELAPYLKIEDAEKTYVKKENIVDSFEGGDPKEKVLSAEKGKELKELVDSLEDRKVDSVTATEGKGIIVEGTHNDPTVGILLDPESEKFLSIKESGLNLSGVQDAIDAAVGELSDKVDLESDIVYNINEIFPYQGDGDDKNTWTIQWAIAKLDSLLSSEKKIEGIKCKFLSINGKWRTFTYYGGYFLDKNNWNYDLTSKDFVELATKNLPTATSESNGVMSKEDKAKFDRISEGIGDGSIVDKIVEIVEDTKEIIDNYTVNGYKISTNPSLTRDDIGLGNVTNDAQVKRSEMGVPSGVATLGEDGKILETQLPDSVLGNVKYQGVWDAANNVPKLELNDFESIGHYYISINKGSQFGYDFDPGDWVINSNGRWVKVDNVDSVKSVNGQVGIVELGIKDIPGLEDALESKTTDEDFNRHITDFKNPHKVTKDQVGLGNVDNTADADKPVSKATKSLIDSTRIALETAINDLTAKSEADLEATKAELNNKIDSLASKSENDLASTKKELEASISDLANKTEADITATNNALDAAKKELQTNIDKLATKSETDLNNAKTELNQAISDLASKTEKDLELTKTTLEKTISDLAAKEESDIKDVNTALESAKKELETSISELATKSENDLKSAKSELENKISELSVKTEADLSTLRADLESSISVTKTDLESKISDLSTKTDSKFQATDSKIDATRVELQTNIDKLSHRHDDDMKDIRQEIEDAVSGSNEALNNHIADKENPHKVTKDQVGLGEVTNDAQVKRSEMGIAGGVATLGEDGKVPATQLPSFVDDVIEVDSFDNLPEVGETGKIYVTKDTNLTYRWSGSQYVEISESLALGETSSTAYPGDKGKATTDKLNSHVDNFENPHKVTAEQVGLGKVDNTSDLEKPVSNATQELVDNTKKELEELINNSDSNIQGDISKLDERVTKIEDSVGAVNGIASLDKDGQLVISQIPEEALNVVEGKYLSDTKFTNSEGIDFIPRHNTIYIDSIGGSNKLYRWDGFKYVELSDSDNATELINNHLKDLNNPHHVTKDQVGLGNVDNTADYDKPVSKATQDELDKLDNRISTIDNSIGAPSGIATLDGNSKLTDSQIPDKTINVLTGKFVSESEFKNEEGESYEPRVGVIYIDTVSGTEKIYRWTKYEYVEISNTKDFENLVNSHITNEENPHKVTKNQVGLGEVTNDAQVKRAEMGAAGGVATLNENGKIPVDQLPGQIDEVFGIDHFVDIKTDIPSSRLVVGTTYYVKDEKKIYTVISDNELDEGVIPEKGIIYSNRETNIIYRWDGATLVEIGNPIHLGEVEGTAYPGDKGKATTDKLNSHVDNFENPHKVTAEQVGLGKVDNTSDLDKPISTATQESLDSINKEISDHKSNFENPHKVTAEQVGLGNVDNTADLDKPVSTATQELVDDTKKELDTKISNHVKDLNNPHQVTKEQVGLGNVDNTADVNKPVSVAQQALVDSTKAELKQEISGVENTINNHVINKNNPHEVNKLQIGLGNVDNTSDIDKPVSTAQQSALDKLRSDLESVIGSTESDLSSHLKDYSNPHKVTKDQVGLGKVDNTSDLEKPVSKATQEAINTVQSNLDKTNIALENHVGDFKNPHKVTKDQVGLGNVDNTSDADKPVSHYQQDALDELERRLQGSIDGSNSGLEAHLKDFNNPHQVTKDQIGLGKVDNTSDLEKPISTATQEALDSIKGEINTSIGSHIADKENPHKVTKDQVGLGEVTNDAQVKRSEMGIAGGVATLDQEGKVPASQLPSFVDDVIEVDSFDNLPEVGEASKIYVTKDTNLTYRWSGTKYIEISASLALGETSSTAYAGDKGKATTDKLDEHLINYDNPHKVTKAQVGLDKVDNTPDLEKPVSNATQELINEVKETINSNNTTITDNLTKHIEDFNNPHKVTKDQVGLGNVDNTADKDKPLSEAMKEAIKEVKDSINTSGANLSAHLKDYNNPHRVTKDQVGLGNVDNTADKDKPLSDATQKELEKLDAKIEKINADQGTDLSNHIKDFDNPHKVTKAQVGLDKVDNTADIDKPVSNATQKAINDALASSNTALENHTNRTDNPHKVTAEQVGLGNVDNTADTNKPVSVAQQAALDSLSSKLNAAINSHVTNVSNPHQVTKDQIGLGKVDNTTDLEKPISTATQKALDTLDASINSKITETNANLEKHQTNKNNPHEVTKDQIGLGNVDNTSDKDKPISDATQAALDKKVDLTEDSMIPEKNLPPRTLHSLFYKGFWDAKSNSPVLNNGNKEEDGDYYFVTNGGERFGYVFMSGDIAFNANGSWYRLMGSNQRDERTKFEVLSFIADRYVFEKGESASITFNWEYQMTPDGQVNFQFINEHNIPVENREITLNGITQDTEFVLNSSFLNEVAKASLSVKFYSKFYVGISSNTTVEDEELRNMDSYFVDGKTQAPLKSFDCTGGKYIYIAIPSDSINKYGIFANSILVTDTVDTTRNVINASGGSIEYKILRLSNKYNGILNIEVKLI